MGKKSPSTLEQVIGSLADAAGVRDIARAGVKGEREALERIARAAREKGISERRIQWALRLKKKTDRALVYLWILQPFLPNPALLRLLAGPEEETGKRKPPTRPRTRKSP